MNSFELTNDRLKNAQIKQETDCIRTVVLNISEFCNLQCLSCPRSKGYKNRKLFMSSSIAQKIKERLDEIKYNGIISISGMGEPFAHPFILNILKILKEYNIQIITNGLYPSKDY